MKLRSVLSVLLASGPAYADPVNDAAFKACMARRAEIAEHAKEESDPDAHARVLASMPVCERHPGAQTPDDAFETCKQQQKAAQLDAMSVPDLVERGRRLAAVAIESVADAPASDGARVSSRLERVV